MFLLQINKQNMEENSTDVKEYAKQYLGKIVTIKINRPLNSKHPKYDFVYETNYGFIPDTEAPDGEEIDAYLLGVDGPLDEFTGKCIAIVHRLDDDDDKLVVVPESIEDMTDEEILKATNFQEQWFKAVVIRK